MADHCPSCDGTNLRVVDDSFDHEFGVERLWHLECRDCGHEWGGAHGRPPKPERES